MSLFTVPQLAEPPFDKKNGSSGSGGDFSGMDSDVVITSSDDVYFHAHGTTMAMAPVAFTDMYAEAA